MPTLQTLYPSTSSVALTISLGGLTSGAQGVYTSGQQSQTVDNRTFLDLDHLLSGKIKLGTSPTASRSVNVYVFANISSASGTPTYPDTLTGIDAARTLTSANVMANAVKFCASMTTDAVTGRDLYFGPVSIASLFGGVLPKWWGVFVAHDSAVNLDATGSNHVLTYERVQGQSV